MSKPNSNRKIYEFKISLIHWGFIVCISEKLSEATDYAVQFLGEVDSFQEVGQGAVAAVLKLSANGNYPIIWIQDTTDTPIFAHEALHATKDILNHLGIEDEEMESLLLQYMMEKFLEIKTGKAKGIKCNLLIN